LALFLFHFGWGKPVVIDPYNLRNPRRDQALIALAGPASNLITAIGIGLGYRLATLLLPSLHSPLLFSFLASVVIMSLGLGLFNLIPLHPLDGAKIILGFLPLEVAQDWEDTIGRYSLILLILLFLPIANGQSLIQVFLIPLVSFLLNLLLPGVSFI
jgi:Zn-dependent protease